MTLSALTGPLTAAGACTDAVRAAILRGEFAAGSNLPPERELAAQLGVNRVTLRAALTRLQSEGLISTRQGAGHLVHDFKKRGGPQLLASLGRSKVHFADLLAVRRALAGLVLERLFAEPPSASALEGLGREVDRLEGLAGAPLGEVVRADLEVMAKLLSLTGSVTLQLCINPVASALLHLPALQQAMFADLGVNVGGYRALIEALGQARKEKALGRAKLARRVVKLLEAVDTHTLGELDS